MLIFFSLLLLFLEGGTVFLLDVVKVNKTKNNDTSYIVFARTKICDAMKIYMNVSNAMSQHDAQLTQHMFHILI